MQVFNQIIAKLQSSVIGANFENVSVHAVYRFNLSLSVFYQKFAQILPKWVFRQILIQFTTIESGKYLQNLSIFSLFDSSKSINLLSCQNQTHINSHCKNFDSLILSCQT